MANKFTFNEFDSLMAKVSGSVNFFAPVSIAGKGRFSDTSLVKYKQVHSIKDIEVNTKSYLSAKEIILPATQKLFDISDSGDLIASVNNNTIKVIFLRSCDIHAIHRLDQIFLKNGNPDPYYHAIRNTLRFVLMECSEQFESCFCVSMGTNKIDEYSAAVKIENESVIIDFKDKLLAEVLCVVSGHENFELKFPVKDINPVSVPNVQTMPEAMFTHQLFDEYDSRCIACGRCNTSCPTCSCFSTLDVKDTQTNKGGERRRIWDGCHLDGFTDMAGGHSFRKKNGSRMRFKTFHKIYDFRKRFGRNMCVGCGRCDDVCPEYISFAECINKVDKALIEVKNNGQ